MFDRIDPNFEPSRQTIEAMLYARKLPLLLSGIQHPGLFGIHNYTVDWVRFILVLILEAVGLYFFYDVLNQGETEFLVAAIAVLAMFAVDFILAIFHHRFATGINAKLKIESIFASKKEGTPAHMTVENNKDTIRKRERISFMFSICLIILAGLKFTAFYNLGDGGDKEWGMILFIAVAYLLAAIIHIKATGFLIHAVWANWLYSRDVKNFKSSGGTSCHAQDRPIVLSNYPDFNQSLSVNSHSVIAEKNLESNETQYILNAHGMLMDKDIEEFAFKVRSEAAKTELVLKGMELQVKILGDIKS